MTTQHAAVPTTFQDYLQGAIDYCTTNGEHSFNVSDLERLIYNYPKLQAVNGFLIALHIEEVTVENKTGFHASAEEAYSHTILIETGDLFDTYAEAKAEAEEILSSLQGFAVCKYWNDDTSRYLTTTRYAKDRSKARIFEDIFEATKMKAETNGHYFLGAFRDIDGITMIGRMVLSPERAEDDDGV